MSFLFKKLNLFRTFLEKTKVIRWGEFNDKEFLILVDYLIRHKTWEMRVRPETDLNLIKEVENANDRERNTYSKCRRLEDEREKFLTDLEFERKLHQEEIDKREREIVHLKDLIQAKDLIIKKLEDKKEGA